MYYDFKERDEEEREKKRIERENAKRKILERMREHNAIKREYEAAVQQEAEEKQAREDVKKDLEILNLRWEHTEKEIADKRPDFTVIGDTIKLHADVKNGDGNKSLFEIHDLNIPYNIDPEQWVAEKKSIVEAEASEVEWKVSDPRSKKNADREIDVYFLVKVKDVYSENCEIPVKEAVQEELGVIVDINGDPIANLPFFIYKNNSDEFVEFGFTTEQGEILSDLSREDHYIQF